MFELPGNINHATMGRRLRGRNAIAEFLGIHPRTVDTWKKRGMPLHKPGKEVEGWTEEILGWMKTQ